MDIKRIKLLAFSFMVLSYLSLIPLFILDEIELQMDGIHYIFLIWGIGIIGVPLNIYYASKIKLKKWILVLLIISGIVWIFPPFFMTFFGIPLLLIYLVISLNFHFERI